MKVRYQAVIASCLLFLPLAQVTSAAAETANKMEPEQPVGELDEIEGVVRVVGPAATSEVLLDPGSGAKGPSVCKSDLSKRISKLTNYTVKVKGPWFLHKGKKRCVTPETFTVTRAPSGRDAVVGVLTEQSGSFKLEGNDGKTHALSEVPDGLKKLAGKKVILDLKSTDNPAAKDEFKIVIYAQFPE